MIKTFSEWLADRIDEGRPAGWSPGPRVSQDPMKSMLIKLYRTQKAGHGIFQGQMSKDVIADKAGLDDEEKAILNDPQWRLCRYQKDGDYSGTWVIDQNVFARMMQFAQSRMNTNKTAQAAGPAPMNITPPAPATAQAPTGSLPPPPPPPRRAAMSWQ
jgi:hypothetical protein